MGPLFYLPTSGGFRYGVPGLPIAQSRKTGAWGFRDAGIQVKPSESKDSYIKAFGPKDHYYIRLWAVLMPRERV